MFIDVLRTLQRISKDPTCRNVMQKQVRARNSHQNKFSTKSKITKARRSANKEAKKSRRKNSRKY